MKIEKRFPWPMVLADGRVDDAGRSLLQHSEKEWTRLLCTKIRSQMDNSVNRKWDKKEEENGVAGSDASICGAWCMSATR